MSESFGCYWTGQCINERDKTWDCKKCFVSCGVSFDEEDVYDEDDDVHINELVNM